MEGIDASSCSVREPVAIGDNLHRLSDVIDNDRTSSIKVVVVSAMVNLNFLFFCHSQSCFLLLHARAPMETAKGVLVEYV